MTVPKDHRPAEGPKKEKVRFRGEPVWETGPWTPIEQSGGGGGGSSLEVMTEDDHAPEPVMGALHRMDLAGLPRPRTYISESRGPNGFRWILPGVLGGTPRPGVFERLDYDLEALKRVGAEHVINMCEEPGIPAAAEEAGLIWHHFPVVDMTPPSIEDAREWCARIDDWVEADEPVVVHCRAGIGRTGTLAVAYMIYRGVDAPTALREVRRVEERYVQSNEQEEFLHEFERALE
jgi:protein tyrosine phosphatase (PTP) superfamily phosphohydrolase (DUF442 family)